ncbi:hypothetical protein PWEIH_14219 [Listeria weihenstephanensis FSL R9-0317]|uniref:DUF4064 domain-containing protein n=1 Tax=Listeria weihenstephanensis TaxID=1006155 RepID=A0A1S7FTG3_9LIST|nr:DUF4064 domain-containing protein [Listeria weihenstephanensis]AQY50680.1 hypothetical protein UE46_06300 [Listeria weihenstephanensis]EUJ36235.1 hypothetical protein PWEIH_14219 [Listeria weihenstephanensis FSL R9-0317]MBC1499574.1 DUF4064 domain-containing protein [Listeria weihenstephanensis]
MIKRTAEVVLAVIGMLLGLVTLVGFTVIGFILDKAGSTKEGIASFTRSYYQSLEESGISVADVPSAKQVLDMVHTYAVLALIATIIFTIMLIIGLIFITGNKKPVLAGFMFLIAGIIVTIGGFVVAGFVPGLLLVIAAILSFVRKPKDPFMA